MEDSDQPQPEPQTEQPEPTIKPVGEPTVQPIENLPASESTLTEDTADTPAAAGAIPPATPVVSNKPVHKSRWSVISIVLVLLVLLAGGAYVVHHSYKSTPAVTATKKDIPLIRYGTDGGEVPQYPTNAQNNSVDLEISSQLFEGLVEYQNQTKLVPWLATSWSNPDTSTWIFNLRHGVKFHNGRTMTANDVKYTLDYAVAHQSDQNGNSVLSEASTIKQVDVLGPDKIKIITTTPDPVLLNKLSFLGIVDSKATLGDYNAGTGPYIIKPGTTPNQNDVKLVATNNYWGGHVSTREVDITIYNNADQLTADAAAGKLDLAGDLNANQLSQIKNYKPIYVADLGISYLGLATEKQGSPLQALAARQAIADGLNYTTVLKASGLRGEIANQLVPVQLPGHDPAILKPTYNLTKAKQLLASAPNNTMQLTLAYPAGDDPQVNEIVKELGAVGFNIKPISVADFGTLINDTTAGKYDMFYLSDSSGTVDGLDILSTLLTNNSYYDNAQIDTLINQAGSTFDPSTRIKLLQQISDIANAQKPLIPLYTVTRTYALTKPLYVLKVDLPSLGSSTYFWQAYQN